MNVPAIYMGNMIASATIPAPAILVEPVHAWVLVLTLLTLCCGILWAVTRPVRAQHATPARRRLRSGGADRRRGTLLNAGGRRGRRPMSVASGASTGSAPPFNAAASIAGSGGMTA
jgi:hypothetical protein